MKYCLPGWNKRKKARSFLVKRTELHNCRVAIIFCKINAMQIGELLMYILFVVFFVLFRNLKYEIKAIKVN